MTLSDFLSARIGEDEKRDTAYDIGAGLLSPRGAWRWRAECQAKRRILAEWESAGRDTSFPRAATLRPVVLALAMPYADHPDYDKSWRL